MDKLRIFISSVQTEFAFERQMLYDFITLDALLGRFFEVFIFEILPAKNKKVTEVYLEQVKQSDIYLGIFGKEYGFEDESGLSPTEREFDAAHADHKIRLIFLSNHPDEERHPKERVLIKKVENIVIRKKFLDPNDLKTSVYVALVNLLEEKELIRSGPFDATVCKDATLDDIDPERIKWFIGVAGSKRGFPVSPESSTEKVLTHLHLMKSGKLTNAAILLFGKQPQRFFITAEVRCVMFYGNEIQKPIPSYQVYKGDVFQLVDQSIDFLLSRIDIYVGDRSQSVDVPIHYEIPRSALAEAIVNAVAHRDYTSTGSVQVMLFRNRVEVWNPGRLPFQLTISELKKVHESFPANPLIAEPLYLAGYIERIGTGIPDMIKNCLEAGLQEPEFAQETSFRAIIWRKKKPTQQATEQATEQATDQVSGEVTEQPTEQPTEQATEQVSGEVSGEVTKQPTEQPTEQVNRMVIVLEKEMTRQEMMEKLDLKHRPSFLYSYIQPALDGNWIEMTIPNNPNDPNQKYRLTAKGVALKRKLKKSRK